MSRLLAALLLFAWTACYLRCAMEVRGGDVGAAVCCQHEGAEAGSTHDHEPLDEHTSCGICVMLTTGSLHFGGSLVSFISLLLLALAALPVAILFVAAFFAAPRVENLQRWLRRCLVEPPQRLAEFLARTTCPVRGPDFMLS